MTATNLGPVCDQDSVMEFGFNGASRVPAYTLLLNIGPSERRYACSEYIRMKRIIRYSVLSKFVNE